MKFAPASFSAAARARQIEPPPGNVAVLPPVKWPIAMLGVPFDSLTRPAALARLEEMIRSGQPHFVVTANVDFLVQAHRDVELRRILSEADLVLCDGTPLVWASSWLGNPLPERVAGADLIPELLAAAATRGHRVFFLGAGPGVAAEASERLRQQHPSLQIVGHYSPPFATLLEMDHEEITRQIRATRPDILLVAFGCPKQEKWIAMHHRALGVPVTIGVGATLDFLAGRVRRAPHWMRHSGTEWLFRLSQEPRRLFHRYANDLLRFLPAIAAEWWRLRHPDRVPVPPRIVAAFDVPGWCRIDAAERLTQPALERHGSFWREILQHPGNCLLDASRVCCVDGTGVALLVRWRKAVQARGCRLVLLAPSAALRGVLESMHLSDWFETAADAESAARQAGSPVSQPRPGQDGTTRSLAWCGEIIAANAEEVWQMTSRHVEAFATHQASLVIIDLSELRFIDSSGAALMWRLREWARDRPVEILFTHAQANVRNVLRLTRLDQLLLEGDQ